MAKTIEQFFTVILRLILGLAIICLILFTVGVWLGIVAVLYNLAQSSFAWFILTVIGVPVILFVLYRLGKTIV